LGKRHRLHKDSTQKTHTAATGRTRRRGCHNDLATRLDGRVSTEVLRRIATGLTPRRVRTAVPRSVARWRRAGTRG
jgi:hypothetical protein